MWQLMWGSLALVTGIFTASLLGVEQQTDARDPIVDWLQTRVQPIARVEPGPDQTDLQFLLPVLSGVQVVGLGEATHGTREFFQLKHRLVQFLVTELGFTVLAMEASTSDIEPLNDYVLHGTGDLSSALTAQGYILWDTEEFAAMMEWIRAHNARVPLERRVQVVGLDILMHTRGRTRVLEYLRVHAPGRVAETEAVFQILAEEEANIGSTRLRPERVAASFAQLEGLRDFLLAQQTRESGVDSTHDVRLAARDVQRMIQRALSARPPDGPGHLNRSVAMGRNAVELLGGRPGSKMIVWAYNGHVADRSGAGRANLGFELREALGEAYYVIGFELGRGRVQVRPPTAQGTVGPLGELEVAPPPAESLPWYLSQAGTDDLFVGLRAPHPALVEDWLARPIEAHAIVWAHEAHQATTIRAPVGRYDGLVFVRVSTPARPTKNAVEKAARGDPG